MEHCSSTESFPRRGVSSHRNQRRSPHRLSPHAGHLIIFHFLTEGRAYAKLEDGTREELTAGDIVVFPHGDAHFLAMARR